MKRKFVAILLGTALALGTAGSAVAAQHGPPGPGNSHNGNCTGNPANFNGNSC